MTCIIPCRHYTASYGYVGGYYGACTAEAMMAALVRNGPLSVSFEVSCRCNDVQVHSAGVQVYDDFMLYKGGVYHHTGHITATSFTPFEVGLIHIIQPTTKSSCVCADDEPRGAAGGVRAGPGAGRGLLDCEELLGHRVGGGGLLPYQTVK